jgi:hypothetical protein
MTMKKAEIVFMVFLLIVFIIFVVLAFGYNAKARVVPLVVGIPAIALSMLLLMSYWMPALDRKINNLKQMEFFELDIKDAKEQAEQTKQKQANEQKALLREFNIVFWILGLFLGILLVGFLVTIPAFVFIFLKFREKEKWSAALTVSVGTELGIWLLFGVLLKSEIYMGMVFHALLE